MHTSQLRQPGDYLKNNRTVPPCVHMFTVEPNENRKQTLNGKLSPSYEREQLETTTKRVKTDTERNTYTPQTRTDRRKCAKRGCQQRTI